MIPRTAITLGVLAGGRGQRLGGRDKAWVLHHGKTLLQHTLSAFPGGYAERLVSAREPDPRFEKLALRPVFDQRPGFPGPLAALEALCATCTTPWLLTVPVDVQRIPDDLPDALRAAVARDGVVVKDATGLQPLIGLWRTAALLAAVRDLLDAGESAAHRVVSRLDLARMDISPRLLANLNTPEDLQDDAAP
ncbi:MAG: molybdenum cofactor guanylyltransferase [Arenimonas sp.]|nr:molybdenum cofactor guanylyltransferase [Arenimonas sp.]